MAQQDKFEVWYRAESFPPSFHVTGRMEFSAADLAHALFVTGRAPGDRWSHGVTSVFEWLHRATLIPAYIRRSPQGRLVRSDLARELDRSEKVSLSYMLGQAMTGIFSQKVVSVRFLMHVDRYSGRHGMVFAPNSKKRADLFGQRLSDTWVVAEAKGRSGGVPAELRDAMTAQKRAIRSVAGERPEIAYGCVAHFPKEFDGSEFLKILAVDPPEDEPEAIDLHVDPDKFIQAYYEPFLAALHEGQEGPTSGGYRVSGYGQFGLRVGVLHSIVNRVIEAGDGRLSGLHEDVTAILRRELPEYPLDGQFHDGTMINTKWQDALAQEDWSQYYGDKPFRY